MRLRELHPHLELIAVHVNHGLQAQAKQWEGHCLAQAEALKVTLQIESVALHKGKRQSLEDLARQARYQALAKHVNDNTLLLTGQHQDDQLETLLLALKRGSGLTGLAAMPEARTFAKGLLLRPLLSCSREQVLAYANTEQLSWVEDPSNQSNEFDRNYLRQQVLPLLSERWPQFASNAQRSCNLLQESESLLTELAEQDLASVARGSSLSVEALLSLSEARQNNLIRHWLSRAGWYKPSQAQLQELKKQLHSVDDANMQLSLSEGQVRRHQGLVHAVSNDLLDAPSKVMSWPVLEASHLSLTTGGRLIAEKGGHLAMPMPEARVEVRYREQVGNPKFSAYQRAGSRSLKKLLQEAGIAPWLRDKAPLLFYDEVLVAIADCYVSQDYVVKAGEGLRLSWQPVCSDKDLHQPV